MTQYAYSPDTGEIINIATPSAWMGTTDVLPPIFDHATAGCFWRGTAWEIVPGKLDPTDAEKSAAARQDNVARLWSAAHDYEYQFINGMAIGLLTIGVMQSKPISLAIRHWSKSIWDLYYTRKALVTDIPNPSLNDFSVLAAMPHSIPELMVELGV